MKKQLTKQEARELARSVWREFLDGPGAADALIHLSDGLPALTSEPTRFLATLALPDELDILPILVSTGRPVFVPVTLPEGSMEFRLLYDGGRQIAPIERGFRGVPGPHRKSELLVLPLREEDVVLVPSRGANPSGFRLGRGLGYYDRWRMALQPCRRIAVLPRELRGLDFQEQEHDLRLHIAFSEDGPLEY